MAKRILSIEIGQSTTRILETTGSAKSTKILHMVALKTPEDAFEDGLIHADEDFIYDLKGHMKVHHIKAKGAYFVLAANRIANREVVIPKVKDNRIKEMVQANASDYFPMDLEQYYLVHEVIDRFTADDGDKIRLSVLAIPKDIAKSYQDMANALGLDLLGLSYSGTCVRNILMNQVPTGLRASIHLSEDTALFNVLEDDKVIFQRNLNFGIGDAIETVRESGVFGQNLSYPQTLTMMANYPCFKKSVHEEETTVVDEETGKVKHLPPQYTPDEEKALRNFPFNKENLFNLQEQTTNVLSMMLSSLSRTVDYYQSRNAGKHLEKIYLTGPGASCMNLRHLVRDVLGCEVESIVEYSHVTAAKGAVEYARQTSSYCACIGAQGAVMDLGLSQKKGLSMELGKKKAVIDDGEEKVSLVGPILILFVCLLGAAVLYVYPWKVQQMLTEENTRLTNQKAQLSYILDVEAARDDAANDYAWAEAVAAASASHNDDLVAFIEELEEKMPSEIVVLTLSATQTTVSLNMQVESKTAAADVILQLRTFDSIDVTSVSTISDVKDDAGETTVSFSVTCTYIDKVASDDAEEEE